MTRGYSASRTGNKRPTLRIKRERSVSMQNLRTSIEKRNTSVATAAAAATESEKKNSESDVMKTSKKTVTIGAGADRQTTARSQSGRRKRSSSTLRMQIAEMEREMESDLDASEDEQETVQKPDVMTKYKSAGKVVDEVLDILAAACVAGADTKTLCDLGDSEMQSRLKSLFSKAKDAQGRRIQKGICYPTNISVNEVLCNHAPFRADEAVTLQPAQVVKLHCGCHLDGYPVVAARTIVVPATDATEGLSQSGSNAIEAARLSLTGMVRMLRPGTSNGDITDFIAAVGNSLGAEAIEGVLSNRVKRWVLDGMDCIITRRIIDVVPQQDVGECEIGEQQVWALDVAFTNRLGTDEAEAEATHNNTNTNEEEEVDAKTSNTKRAASRQRVTVDDLKCFRTTPTEAAPTMFRRTPVDFPIDARVQQANEVLTEITDRFGCFPFHFKALSNPLRGKMGVNVLQKHQVVDCLSPLRVKNSLSGRRITARFAATVAVTAKRITILCGAPPAEPVAATTTATTAADVLPVLLREVLERPLDFATAAALKAGKAGQPAAKRVRN